MAAMSARTELWTIGHSNHDAEKFLNLLKQHRIEAVADVRSQPYARYADHFSQAPLKRRLRDEGIVYVFLGNELGGRPSSQDFYDDAGHVRYGALAQAETFQDGLRRLLEGASKYRIAMMCSEEDPTHCHRRLLVTRALSECGTSVAVEHIRGNGQLVSEEKMACDEAVEGEQQNLFGEANSWKSAQSVSQNTMHRVSLNS